MKKRLTAWITMMILTSTVASAQYDVHSHMIPESYLEAIKAHLQTAHFKKYKEGTADMVSPSNSSIPTPWSLRP